VGSSEEFLLERPPKEESDPVGDELNEKSGDARVESLYRLGEMLFPLLNSVIGPLKACPSS
jgi:hypothetical protein